MKTVVINGANGYVASNFITGLLKQNYKVVALVRASRKHSPEERMAKALSQTNNGQPVNLRNLQVYTYSLLDPDFAMTGEQLKTIFSEDLDYFHFAASLKYDYKSKEEIFSTNISGLENSLKVYLKYATSQSHFFFIGTAYSCGKVSGVFEERFYDNEDIAAFRNYYEQSKRFAENIIRESMAKNGFNGHIIRLSQVVGDSQTGVTNTDYGIFDFTKRVAKLVNRYPGETVRVNIDPESTQNLIPINVVVEYLLKTVGAEKVPVIMNFISTNPTRNHHIIDVLNKLLPVNIIPLKDFDRKEMSVLERIIDVGMSFTGSYTDTNIHFDTTERDTIIPRDKVEVDEDGISRMLEYFIQELSGKKKKQILNPAV